MSNLNVGDCSLEYQVEGNGPPVVLIHGTGVAGSGWKPQVDELASKFTCLAYDNRGVGKSTIGPQKLTIQQLADDARALMDAVGWSSAHVVGHSLGGLIAEQLALDVPERVRSLALLCTFAKGPEAARITPQVMWMGLKTRVGTRAMRRRAFLDMLFSEEYVKSEGAAALASRVGPMVGRDLADSPAIMMRQLAAMREYDCAERLGELARIPTLVVSAERDPIARPQYGEGLCQRIAGSQFFLIPGASHGVTIEMPERVNDLLRVHFERAEAAIAAGQSGVVCQ